MYVSGERLPKALIDPTVEAVHYKCGRFLPLSDYNCVWLPVRVRCGMPLNKGLRLPLSPLLSVNQLSGLAPYAMGKMAQIGLMNVLTVEGKEHGILVNAISPVATTRMWNVQHEPEDLRPDEVAPGVLYLASPECRESGFILRASNCQFTAVRWIEGSNWRSCHLPPCDSYKPRLQGITVKNCSTEFCNCTHGDSG
jgi:hypothetical protein